MSTSPINHTTAMLQATAALARAGVRFQQKTGFQLKVGPFSFYPGKGTIYRDGNLQAHEEKGLPAFLRLLRDDGLGGVDAMPVKPVDDPEGFIIDLGDQNGEFATR